MTGRSVLVVEDDPEYRSAVKDMLSDEGYDVPTCADGQEALDRLRGGESADVIVLDLMMPRLDGWEFRIAQKQDPRLARIPVLVLSADTTPKAAAIHADAYLSKTSERDVLLAGLERVLREDDQRKHQAAVAERARLVALGTLASGIAHEINNPLTVIAANLELLAAGATAEDDPQILIDEASQACRRVAAIVRDMQLFSRTSTDATGPTDVTRVLDAAANVLSTQLRGRVKLVKAYEPVPRVNGNEALLGQLFLNLLINAAEAIDGAAASTHHEIRIGVRREVGTPERVIVEVSDTGVGIPSEILVRIFEPFFTTKPVGAGMGLGLSIVHGLVEGMHGEVSVTSSPDRGTTFRVGLPASPPTTNAPPRTRATHRARILVIDDEPEICKVLVRVLGGTHEVESTTLPEQAIARVTSGARFDLILCDMSMPGMSGIDVYTAVREISEDQAACIAFITGGVVTESGQRFLAEHAAHVLLKPFSIDELHARIAEFLPPPRDAS